MREWKSKINGKNLRLLIKNKESFSILKEINYLTNRILNDVNIFNLDEYDKYNFEELVDDRLNQFYDLCDKNNIWITI